MQIPVENNLGGNINQDISKALLSPKYVYNSENYRVVALDGSSSMSRTNILGNTLVAGITPLPRTAKIDINNTYLSQLYNNAVYEIIIEIDGVVLPAYTFNFSSATALLSGLVDHINTNWGSTIAVLYTGTTPYILVTTGNTTSVTLVSFIRISGGASTVNLTPIIFDSEIANNSLANPQWTLDPAGTAQFAANGIRHDYQYKNGTYYPTISDRGGAATLSSTTTMTRTSPVTLLDGQYTVAVYWWNSFLTGFITQTMKVSVGGNLVGSNVVVSGEDFSGQNFGTPDSFIDPAVVISNNDIEIEFENTITAATCFWATHIYKVKVYGPPIFKPILEIDNNFVIGSGLLYIIGWTTLRDDIYLFTTDCTTDAPGVTDPISYGQIWKFTYDKTKAIEDLSHYSLTMIYNAELNFSTKHPIFNPGRVETRYESSNIQKIYWTDNFNPPRFINVADPNVQSLDVSNLLLAPSIQFDVPVINNILKGGNLKSGMYQYAYRLKRKSGVETRFSMPSSLTFLTTYTEASTGGTSKFITYEGVDANFTVDKTIEIFLDNLDTTFDTVEVAFIFYGKKNSTPEAYVFFEGAIANRSSFTIKHTGEEDSPYPITLDELTAFNVNIRRAKALATKSNTLFLSNVTINTFDVDFDSVAHRFPLNSTTTTVKDFTGSDYTIDSTTWNITEKDGVAVTPYRDEEHDFIQDADMQSPFSTNNLLYKPGSVSATDLDNLGGAGPNISYGFVTQDMIADENANALSPSAGSSLSVPYRNIKTRITTPISLGDRDHPNGGFYDCYVSPFHAPLMAGYQRDEIYRYGIVFFDRLGNPGFTKWIADIRMPHIYMPDGTNKYDRFLAYPLVSHDLTAKKAYTKPLYIKFTVDITSIQDEISGFQICTVPRTDNDKTIIGQGVFNFAQKDYASPISGHTFYMCNDGGTGVAPANYMPLNTNTTEELWPNVGSIKSPDFDYRGYPGYQTGDTIDIISILDIVRNAFIYGGVVLDGNNIPAENVSWTTGMYYKHIDTGTRPYPIKDSTAEGPIYQIHEAFELDPMPGQASAFSTTLLSTYNGLSRIGNFSPSNSVALQTRYSRGSYKVGFVYGGLPPTAGVVNGSYDFDYATRDFAGSTQDAWEGTNKMYIANYKRTLNGQYNGNSFAQRSTNFYVPVSNFFRSNQPVFTDVLIAGGDTYTQVHDFVYDFIDWRRRLGDGVMSEMNITGSVVTQDNSIINRRGGARTMHMPLESTINTELRGSSPRVPNFIDPPGSPTSGNSLDIIEDFISFDTDLFSWNPSYMIHASKPTSYTEIVDFDTRTYKSEPKDNSEDVDSWTVIKEASFLDVDSKYGPINNTIIFKDKLFYFQDRGFGILQVNEQQVIQDATSTSELVLGSSGILTRYDYISTVVGSKLQSGFAVSDEKLFFTDILSRKVYTFNGQGAESISDIKGLSSYLYRRLGGNVQNTDNPIEETGVVATYDYKHNEFLLTMLDVTDNEYFTVAYNQLTDGFTGFYTYYPSMFINDKLNIFTVPVRSEFQSGNIYVQNAGQYGVFFNRRIQPSLLSFLVNHESDKEKILTNMEFVTESYSIPIYNTGIYDPYSIPNPYDFFSTIRVFNSYQNTDYIEAGLISKRRKTLWNVKVPGNRVLYNNKNTVDIFDASNISPTRLSYIQRMKDRWFMVDTTYSSATNRFVISSATSLIMLNTR